MARQASQDFVTSGDAARALGVSKQHLHRLVEAGHLAASIRAANGYLLFTRREVERLRAVRRASPPRRGPKPRSRKMASSTTKHGSGKRKQ